MAKPAYREKVTCIKHYSDSLFSFGITRPEDFNFSPGQFVMLGIEINNEPLMRAYSIASSPYSEKLEFYSIKIPNGPLTSELQHINIDDDILLSKKPVGNLTIWDLQPGRRLFLFSTGTGIAPFASIIKDPETYHKYDQIILTHTCRNISDLIYGFEIVQSTMDDPLCGEMAKGQLMHYTSTTQEDYTNTGRITNLIENEKLFSDLNIDTLNGESDRVMICGSMDMVRDLSTILESRDMKHSTGKSLEQYVYERAFVG